MDFARPLCPQSSPRPYAKAMTASGPKLAIGLERSSYALKHIPQKPSLGKSSQTQISQQLIKLVASGHGIVLAPDLETKIWLNP